MPDTFLGRTEQLSFLEERYRSPRSEFIPIYGRRRVGKSELILRFTESKPVLYFVATLGAAPFQIAQFMEVAARNLHKPFLASLPLRDWRTALHTVGAHLDPRSKTVIALDEFQWAVQAAPELPSILQQLWDQQWSKSGNVFLVLCGSYIGFMEREVLGKKSPLFGRRTGQILLRPFAYDEARLFHPGYSLEEKARTYFVCGGIPLYLRMFDAGRSVTANITESFLHEFAPLHREVDFLLREELGEVESHYSILTSLAEAQRPVSDIAASTGIDARNLPHYLNQLCEIGYVQRVYPIVATRPSRRAVRYRIADPLLRFWFTFIYPHRSTILQIGRKAAYREILKPRLQSYFGLCFERLCAEAVPMLHIREGIEPGAAAGQYWDKTCQIDLVALRRDGWIDLGECKWGRVSSAPAMMRELDGKIASYPNPRNATILRRVFTRKRLSPPESNVPVRWHCLEDLYQDS